MAVSFFPAFFISKLNPEASRSLIYTELKVLYILNSLVLFLWYILQILSPTFQLCFDFADGFLTLSGFAFPMEISSLGSPLTPAFAWSD
jgi:hypothetical protein